MSILSACTKYDILDKFPCLTSLGANCLGEDADMFGNTLAEAIQWGPRTYNLPFKTQTIDELTTLLAYGDADIDRVSWAVLGINPTADVEEPPNWGSFPSLRAFWSSVLHAFENDPEVQAGREIAPEV
ncbi:hypothetical protein WSS15_28730 [Acetobacter pasteurianus]|uniref:hypothetical protein n=1 Tax=Acetobacter pasteurianus TaxID=438 RepID=UPI00074D42FA|nr:hypothetical protein [Acetobacter pasteurianus]QHM91335.1 hypothetical protein FCN51_07095 [Acetobacter pasteurianus]BAU37243.1 hypothetical protein APT_00161 [Acetobacter pasteurianus NBRC 101655]GLH30223.1 hypothetical protein WSS15_28730 [Acetobacter pasteurianus]